MTTNYRNRLSSFERVGKAAETLDLKIDIKRMEQSTRTAEEAASACGCNVAQIVKSLVFESEADQALLLCLVSGVNQVNIPYLSKQYGITLKRCDTRRVRNETGFAIGGVAPIGHINPIAIYMDESLLKYEHVWAAAGRPDSIFKVSSKALAEAINAKIINVVGPG